MQEPRCSQRGSNRAELSSLDRGSYPLVVSALADRIRELRLGSRYPRVEDFASKVGVSARAIQFYERGQKIPRLPTLTEIAAVAGLDDSGRDRLAALRAEATAKQLGSPHTVLVGANPNGLARRLAAQAVSVLRRRGRVVSRLDGAALQEAFADFLRAEAERSGS